jgi:hypothetical protein
MNHVQTNTAMHGMHTLLLDNLVDNVVQGRPATNTLISPTSTDSKFIAWRKGKGVGLRGEGCMGWMKGGMEGRKDRRRAPENWKG